jgi:hypothetical protein
MAITEVSNAFVDAVATSINLSSIFNVTLSSSNPTYLVLTALDRNEYTVGASGATGSFTGNGQTASFTSQGGDARGAGIVFTYQPLTGLYYNSTYGYLNQLIYNSSSSLDDVTSLSLFGTSNLSLANTYAANAYDMMEVDAAGYLGSATVATEPSFTGTVPAQATPDSIATVADSFVGKAWNLDGCWVLASTIAAEAGASLPAQSTLIGLAGQSNGEWIVAFNGPAGQTSNWQNMVTAGEIVVIGTPGGGGHITTVVSGSGSTAMLVDNITYVNQSGQIVNPANDGSANDVLVASPHLASQEWAGVAASSVVIYELDTPIVTANEAADALAFTTSQNLGSLFTAVDPASKAITEWQVYDTATSDYLVYNSADLSDHSAGSALTVASLGSVALLAGGTAATDTLDVRAYNGSYWGDWTPLNVAIAATAVQAPVLATQTAAQTWAAGGAVNLALPANTFTDPQSQALTYAATLSSGQALPSWLSFNPTTRTFTGTAPTSAQSLSIKVTATDTSGLSASETFAATVPQALKLAVPTPNQTWTDGQAVSFTVPAGTFTDSAGSKMTFAAYQTSGTSVTSWLHFNATTDKFTGTVPANATGTVGLEVIATDNHGLTVADLFSVTFAAAAGQVGAIAVHGSVGAAEQPTVSSPAMLTSAHTFTFHQAVEDLRSQNS